jgi:hypothetical protein
MNIPTNNWTQIDINSGDITIIEITGEWGMLTVFNIYNDCKHNHTIELLSNFQRQRDGDELSQPRDNVHMVWLGDFNRHHLHWDNVADSRRLIVLRNS